jgi:hypothetical protein
MERVAALYIQSSVLFSFTCHFVRSLSTPKPTVFPLNSSAGLWASYFAQRHSHVTTKATEESDENEESHTQVMHFAFKSHTKL